MQAPCNHFNIIQISSNYLLLHMQAICNDIQKARNHKQHTQHTQPTSFWTWSWHAVQLQDTKGPAVAQGCLTPTRTLLLTLKAVLILLSTSATG
jgi:hypothetical protein